MPASCIPRIREDALNVHLLHLAACRLVAGSSRAGSRRSAGAGAATKFFLPSPHLHKYGIGQRDGSQVNRVLPGLAVAAECLPGGAMAGSFAIILRSQVGHHLVKNTQCQATIPAPKSLDEPARGGVPIGSILVGVDWRQRTFPRIQSKKACRECRMVGII